MVTYPVEQSDGCTLQRFDRTREAELTQLDRTIPITAALVVVWDAGECLLVFNRFRQAWELPGGIIDPGESASEAAPRELLEESEQHASALDFAGVARVWYAPARRQEHLAIYRGNVDDRASFVMNNEITLSMWWNPGEPLDHLNEIDGALVELCPPSPPREVE